MLYTIIMSVNNGGDTKGWHPSPFHFLRLMSVTLFTVMDSKFYFISSKMYKRLQFKLVLKNMYFYILYIKPG